MWTCTTSKGLALALLLVLLGEGHGKGGRLLSSEPDPHTEVQQIHLAQGRDPSVMVVSFLTPKPCSAPQVRYGLSPHALDKEVLGKDTVTYNFQAEGYPDYQSGWNHHVPLVGLEPDTVYYYRCGDFDTGLTSGILNFRTMPAQGLWGKDDEPISFAVIGDLGQTEDSRRTLEHMLEDATMRMVIHSGDLSYADCEQPRWDSYGRMIEVLAAQRPWMVSAGNHEIELEADQGLAFTAFESRYRMPWVKPARLGNVPAAKYCTPSVYTCEYDYGNSFFSFETGPVHWIFLNPYTNTNHSSPQYKWLSEDLKAVDRKVTPWVLVVMHCPWYNSNKAHYEEHQTVQMREAMEPLFYRFHVNAAIMGHVHAYERTFAVYRNRTVSDGVVYLTIGDAGNREGHASTYRDPQPEWSAFRDGTQFGHAKLTVESNQVMKWQWHRNVDGEAVETDEVTICNTIYPGVSADCSIYTV